MTREIQKISEEPEATHLHLLGKSVEALTVELGEPSSEYPFRDNHILMFDCNAETVFCEVCDGVVKSINTFKDRRTTARIKPKKPKQAYLRHGGHRHAATIIDLSVNSVAMKLTEGCLPEQDEFVTFCTNLRTWTQSRTYVVLAGYVSKISPENQTIVILLDTPFETHSHKTLLDYINAQQLLEHLATVVSVPQDESEAIAAQSRTIIKSDICIMCEERSCGLPSPPANRKSMPLHKGVNERP